MTDTTAEGVRFQDASNIDRIYKKITLRLIPFLLFATSCRIWTASISASPNCKCSVICNSAMPLRFGRRRFFSSVIFLRGAESTS